jgi:predicted nucleotidyltransferase
MKNADLADILARNASALRARGVEHLAIFGSRARGDNRPDSDLDVLIDVPFDRKFSLIDLVAVERIIGETAGCSAGAVMRRSAKPEFLARIANDVIEIY